MSTVTDIRKNIIVQIVAGLGIMVATAVTTVSFIVPANMEKFDRDMKERELHDDRTDLHFEVIERKLVNHDLQINAINQRDSLHWIQLMETMKDIKEGQKLQSEKFDKFVEGYYNRPRGD